ncbi:mechanosensitive ion channel family protein [Rhizobium sp. TH2]|uniref:mechanosensitive ion channel family protein n=1 Tax=Rhizobium sp. TH2 TaxID=2775403 RepID=UPI002157B287|nr:mechanosensitive ion channel family protein [Rhizobium sp. TH2]UVC07270.1 mechanosensitive ion channel family protein [Rhizobium sp. TH2]
MESQNMDFIVASRAAVTQAGALLVQYSFSIVGAFVLLLVGWLASRYLHRWALAGIRGFDVTLAHFLANVVLLFVLVMVLGQFGVQTASIIAAMGAAGLAIGLALQGTLQNIAAGIMLLILRPFRVGESIETKEVNGEVREIGLFATELRTGDGLFQLVPNALLWNTPVKNFSRLGMRRYDLTVVLPADSDIRKAESMLLAIAERDTRVNSKPAPVTQVSDIKNDTVSITLQAWINTSDYGATARALAKSAKISFEKVQEQAVPVEAPGEEAKAKPRLPDAAKMAAGGQRH